MSARVAFTTPTTKALSVRLRVIAAPSGPLTIRVLPSTFSTVPFTRCVCCAKADDATTAAIATAVRNFVLFMLVLPLVFECARIQRPQADAKSRTSQVSRQIFGRFCAAAGRVVARGYDVRDAAS